MNLITLSWSTKREVAGLTSGDGPIAYRKIIPVIRSLANSHH